MTKSNYIWMLLALVCSLGFTACSSDDNDDDGKTPSVVEGDDRVVKEGDKTGVPADQLTDEEIYLLDCQTSIFSVMRNLAGLENVGPDVVESKHEPTFGVPFNGENSLVRAEKCDSIEEAEQMFFSIVGLDKDRAQAQRLLTATPDGYILELVDLPLLKDGKKFTLGTLTFHRGDGSSNFGYIDVDIRCIPNLERIDFVSANAFPENAGAAYHVGDIVWVSSGYCTGYYVCVASSAYSGTLVHMCVNEPGGDDTVNFDGDSQGCWIPYNNRHGSTTTFTDCKNYIGFLLNEKGKVQNAKMFLEGKLVTKKPSHTGRMSHLFPEGFNNDLGVAFHSSDGRGAAIRYDAYYGDYAWVPSYDYRHSKYAAVPQNCSSIGSLSDENYKYVYDSDWNTHYSSRWNYTMNVIHFDDEPISGASLEFIASEKVVTEDDASEVQSKHLGWVYADDNHLYESADKAQKAGHNALGIVVYVNDDSDFGNMVTEKEAGFGNGLVMSYKELIVPVDPEDYKKDYTYDYGSYVDNNFGSMFADRDGLDKTDILADEGFAPAVYLLETFSEPTGTFTSNWFIPTTAQWSAIFFKSGLGGGERPNDRTNYADVNIDKISNSMSRDAAVSLSGKYWTSSAANSTNHPIQAVDFTSTIYNLYFKTVSTEPETFLFWTSYETESIKLRPFFAF